MMNIRFDNQTAIVFGAAGGIGEAIVTLLASNGAKVYIADYDLVKATEIRDRLIKTNLKAEAVFVNVGNYDEVQHVVQQAFDETGKVDIVINNAGIVGLNGYLETTQEEFQRLINVNLIGVDNGTKAALKFMIPQNYGKIVNTSSFAGRKALQAGFAHYGITKAGIIYLSQAAAYVGAPYNINVNTVCPGIIRSAIWEKILDNYEDSGKNREEAWKESLKKFIPLARGDQKAMDIAYTVAFLCSTYANHITGQALNVDGGASMD